ISRVNEKPIRTLAELQKASADIKQGKDGTPTLVEVRRGGARILTVVNVHAETSEDTSVEVAKPFFPASTQVVTQPLATALKLPAGTQGVRITQIHPGSAASTSGLQIGDILLELDRMPIEASA